MGKEHIIPIDITLNNWSEGQHLVDRNEAVMQQLEREAQTKLAVIVEGPPIYLWPPSLPEFESVQWRSNAFRNGWKFVNAFVQRIPDRKLFQYVLVDDLNYLPKNTEKSDIGRQIMKLRTSSPEIGESMLFQPHNTQTKVIVESQLAAEMGTTKCSKVDGAFNAKKILDQVESRGNLHIYPGNVNKIMLTVVNPDSSAIRSEQLNMLMETYRILRKNTEFQKYSKKYAAEAITETFRHVWLHESGNVKGITKPMFHGSHFSFVGR